MVSTYGGLLKDFKNTQEDIEFLNRECLSKDPTSLEEKIRNIIENELTNQEDGYEKRVIDLQNLNASMEDILKNFEDASNEEKVKIATQIFISKCKVKIFTRQYVYIRSCVPFKKLRT